MKPPSQANRDYEVGYRKPPQHSRFKPGQSGNPKGRPKDVMNFVTALHRALNERVIVVEGNRRKSITKTEAMFKTMVNRAVKGDARAVREVISMAPSLEALLAGAGSPGSAGDAAVLATLIKRLQSADTEESASDVEASEAEEEESP